MSDLREFHSRPILRHLRPSALICGSLRSSALRFLPHQRGLDSRPFAFHSFPFALKFSRRSAQTSADERRSGIRANLWPPVSIRVEFLTQISTDPLRSHRWTRMELESNPPIRSLQNPQRRLLEPPLPLRREQTIAVLLRVAPVLRLLHCRRIIEIAVAVS